MVLQNFFKVVIEIGKQKYTYYGSDTYCLEFNEQNKHEIIWQKPIKSNVNTVAEQQSLF